MQRWYGVDPHDPRLYDIVIDSTRLTVDACVDLIALAAAKRGR